MGFPERPPSRPINLRWLVQLRWGAVVGQSLTILLAEWLLGVVLPQRALFAVIALEVASNLVCTAWLHRLERASRPASELALALVMAFDVLLLTALLYLSGGTFNPFNFLYLVHIALAAVVLRPRTTWGLVLLSLASFGALFLLGDGQMDHAHQMDMHLQGMWVAFAVAAGFIVYFVGRIRGSLAARDAELEYERQRTERHAKLASLATLAAGAAHELSTPLGTIAVAASEMQAALERGNVTEVVEDARLISAEVLRCRAVLDQLTAEAGESPGEAAAEIPLAELLAEVAAGAASERVKVQCATDCTVLVPRVAAMRAIRGLVDNALDASEGDVELVADRQGDERTIEVRDSGSGMSVDVLARAREPFFTTKQAGKGMGLGLFLANAVAERLGGRLEITSQSGSGTSVRLVLPDATMRHIAKDG